MYTIIQQPPHPHGHGHHGHGHHGDDCPNTLPLPLWGNALMVVIGAALGIYLYYKKLSWQQK